MKTTAKQQNKWRAIDVSMGFNGNIVCNALNVFITFKFVCSSC